jgi:DNA processing protein
LNSESYSVFVLSMIEGVGPAALRGLKDRFGSYSEVLNAAPGIPEGPGGLPRGTSGFVRSGDLEREAEETLRACRDSAIKITTLFDEGYPSRLKADRLSPPVLYHIGPLDFLSSLPTAAVVGTRAPDRYGLDMACRFGRELSTAGVAVVSGGAFGVDIQAHLGALEARAAPTAAVLGTGLDEPGPRANARVFEKIAASGGCLLSEFRPGQETGAFAFPKRNRTVAALSDSVVVVQGGAGSGALITASCGFQLGKRVFALMGNVDSPLSAAMLEVRNRGGAAIASPVEVLGALGVEASESRPVGAPSKRPPGGELTGDEVAVYGMLNPEPAHVDELASRAGLTAARACSALLSLELKGAARRLPGMLYALADDR